MMDYTDHLEALQGDVEMLAELVERFMVGIMNNLVGTINTTSEAPHVQALTELQDLLESWQGEDG